MGFTSKLTQSLSAALRIKYHLRGSWRPQYSGKAERFNCTLKQILAKLCQEAASPWVTSLPMAFLRLCLAPKDPLQLSPSEMVYGQPFLTQDLVLDPEIQELTKYFINLGKNQKSSRSLETKFFLPMNYLYPK